METKTEPKIGFTIAVTGHIGGRSVTVYEPSETLDELLIAIQGALIALGFSQDLKLDYNYGENVE